MGSKKGGKSWQLLPDSVIWPQLQICGGCYPQRRVEVARIIFASNFVRPDIKDYLLFDILKTFIAQRFMGLQIFVGTLCILHIEKSTDH